MINSYCVAPSSIRINQFKEILDHSKNKKSIILGDFNSMGKWYLNIFLMPFYGINSFSDIYLDESKRFNELSKKFNLINYFKNIYTFLWLPFIQIDYILVSNKLEIKSKKKIKRILSFRS